MNTSVETIAANMPQIYLTDNAAKKLHQLFVAEGKENLKLRIFIEGGGCSGFKYEFAFETSIGEDDQIFKKTVDNVCVEVVIDSMSFLYLQNSEVDYEENFQDSRFIIRNPNAKSSCGCGSSFSA